MKTEEAYNIKCFNSSKRGRRVSKIVPYDGYSTQVKKIKTYDLVHDSKNMNQTIIGKNIVFDKPFL